LNATVTTVTTGDHAVT